MECSAKEPPSLGSYFSSLVPGKGPFYQFRNKSLTGLFEACYNHRQFQQIVEAIFLPIVFQHQISRLLGRLFFARHPEQR